MQKASFLAEKMLSMGKKTSTSPLGHEIELEFICGADIWCNRHCTAKRARIRAPEDPKTGPEPLNFQFLVDFVGRENGGTK